MHLLQAQAGAIADGSEAVDLGQTPGDIVVLSAADTELANLAQARASLPEQIGRVRIANLMQLGHNLSIDVYTDAVIRNAKLVVVRLLGGVGYWPYGVEQLILACRETGAMLALLPGDDQPDVELAAQSSLPADAYNRLWQYLVQGGPDNARHFLAYCADLIGNPSTWSEPVPLLRAGLYWPGHDRPSLADLQSRWTEGAPVAAVVFYRAHLQAGNLEPIDALIGALQRHGVNPLPFYAASLKDPACADLAAHLLGRPVPVLSSTPWGSPFRDRAGRVRKHRSMPSTARFYRSFCPAGLRTVGAPARMACRRAISR